MTSNSLADRLQQAVEQNNDVLTAAFNRVNEQDILALATKAKLKRGFENSSVQLSLADNTVLGRALDLLATLGIKNSRTMTTTTCSVAFIESNRAFQELKEKFARLGLECNAHQPYLDRVTISVTEQKLG